MKEISRKLYLLRILHNYTQNYVAEKLNISGSTYVSIEQGLSNIHYNRLQTLLGVYNLTMNNFFSFTEEDILNVVRGKSIIPANMDTSIYPRLVAKLETLNKLLFQMLQMTMDRQKEGGKLLNPDPKGR